jgi:hypothetical protein
LLDILTMHLPINVKSPNNISKWHMGINSAFKGLKERVLQYMEVFQGNVLGCELDSYKYRIQETNGCAGRQQIESNQTSVQ